MLHQSLYLELRKPHSTIDVPYDVVQYLKKAYDDLEEPLTCFLKSSKVDWHFYDPYMLQLPKRFKEKTKWCGIVSPGWAP